MDRWQWRLTAGVLLVGGALAVTGTAVFGDRVREQLNGNEYIAHEWGTFTSLTGSDGVEQIGLHHGDEALPNFVHCPFGGGYNRCLDLVRPGASSPFATTQRMETPVIYFYANESQRVDVKVDFPDGLLTEWYPQETTMWPPRRRADRLGGGSMTWVVDISTEPLEIPEVDAENIWNAQRQTDANYVSVTRDGITESDRFIFYRGIGRFTTPFKVTSDASGAVTIANDATEDVPSAIILDFRDGKGAFSVLGKLPASSKRVLSTSEVPQAANGLPAQEFLAAIAEALEKDLVASGLYLLEAQAMVNTWKRSYFETEGLRILYVLPRRWADDLVPLSFAPAPKEVVRTFVGRVEVFTHQEEQALLQAVRTAIAEETDSWTFADRHLNRFGEPKLRRLHALATTEAERLFIEEMIVNLFERLD